MGTLDFIARRCAFAALIGIAAAAAAGCSNQATLAQNTPAGAMPQIHHLLLTPPPVPIPASGTAYLGAWVNPNGVPNPSPSAQASDTASLENSMGRTLAVHMHYYGWSSAKTTNYIGSPNFNAEMADDIAHGRIPVISWVCGDSLDTIGTIGSQPGPDKDAVDAAAAAIGALKTPVFLRFFWEFDLDVNGDTKNGDSPNCFDTAESTDDRATAFVTAWQAMHDEFASKGVKNVAWLWNPTGSFSNMGGAELYKFVPAPGYVDWIGVDTYDQAGTGFATTMNPFYNFYGNYIHNGLPVIVAETGENYANDGASHTSQSQYLAQALAALNGNTYPQVRAFMYFDAPGQSNNDWHFNNNGLTKWTALGKSAYFAPTLKNP